MFPVPYVLEVGHSAWSTLLLGVLHCGQHRSEPKQKSKRITSARLRGVETQVGNQHRNASDRIVIANGIRQQWDSAKCISMANRTETTHFAGLT